jgi:type I restriction enzyme R subunit
MGFDQDDKEPNRIEGKSFLQQVFETRLSLAEAAFQQNESEVFQLMINLIGKDLSALQEDSISDKKMWSVIQTVKNPETLKQFSIETSKALHTDIAPLIQYIGMQNNTSAYEFDKVIALSQIELLKQSDKFKDLKAIIVILVDQLPIDLNFVKDKYEFINLVKILNSEFWNTITVSRLEKVRLELRDLMQFRIADKTINKQET